MGLERKIAFAALGGTAVAILMWGASGLGIIIPPGLYIAAIVLGGIGAVVSAVLWCHIGWAWIRSRGLQMGPAIALAIGLIIVVVGGIWGAVTWSPPPKSQTPPVAVVPNISFQKFALFWVETEPHIYDLAIVAKLFNADNKSYLLSGLLHQRTEWKLVPRGSYLVRRYTEFGDKIEVVEDNYIKPNDIGYYKKLLPIRVDMTINGGALPDFILLGHWEIVFGSQRFSLQPRMFGICSSPLTNDQWTDLLKPKSQIDIENLRYFPLPAKVSDWNEAIVVGVPCVPPPSTSPPLTPPIDNRGGIFNAAPNSGTQTVINGPPPPELKTVSETETDNADGTTTLVRTVQMNAPYGGSLAVSIRAPGLTRASIGSIRTVAIPGNSMTVTGGTMLRNVMEGDGFWVATVPQPAGQYAITATTPKGTKPSLDLKFE